MLSTTRPSNNRFLRTLVTIGALFFTLAAFSLPAGAVVETPSEIPIDPATVPEGVPAGAGVEPTTATPTPEAPIEAATTTEGALADGVVETTEETQLAAATPTGSALRVSTSPTRSNSTPLSGVVVKGSIYVFVDISSSNVNAVAFWLDDPNRAFNPIHVEGGPPFDMLGGEPTAANPLTPENSAKAPT